MVKRGTVSLKTLKWSRICLIPDLLRSNYCCVWLWTTHCIHIINCLYDNQLSAILTSCLSWLGAGYFSNPPYGLRRHIWTRAVISLNWWSSGRSLFVVSTLPTTHVALRFSYSPCPFSALATFCCTTGWLLQPQQSCNRGWNMQTYKKQPFTTRRSPNSIVGRGRLLQKEFLTCILDKFWDFLLHFVINHQH